MKGPAFGVEGPAFGVKRPAFGERVAGAVAERGPICAGIDPSPGLLADWGLADDADGLREFGDRCLDAFDGVVAAVKPQVAFFERHGAAGLGALETLLAEARRRGLVAIADAKRGDIPTTSAAYADAWLDDRSPLVADAVTAVPYLGLGALEPILARAEATGRGVVVVVRGSNPEGRVLQEARTVSGRSVEESLLEEIADRNAASTAGSPPGGPGGAGEAGEPGRAGGAGGDALGAVGAVVGATLEPCSFNLGRLGGVVLAPGVGAQGAGPEDLATRFAGCRPGQVLANVSRSILGAGPGVHELRRAARRTRDEMARALRRPR